jgi:hypothetical protein
LSIFIQARKQVEFFRKQAMKTILVTHILILFSIIPSGVFAQYISIQGYVKHASSGQVIKNVNVFEVNSEIGTITSQNGYYKLLLKPGEINLSVTRSGFKDFSQLIEVKNDTTLVVQLLPQEQSKTKTRKTEELQAKADGQEKKIARKGLRVF